MQNTYLKQAWEANDPNITRWLVDTELVKNLLDACAITPGATITITVRHDNGHVATAELYDHAALVQSLYDALEYFQSEL